MFVNNHPSTGIPFCSSEIDKQFSINEIDCLIVELQKRNTQRSRRESLFGLGTRILEAGRGLPWVNWVQFAMMHSGLIVEHTTFSAQAHKESSIQFWLSLLTSWEKGEGVFLHFSPDLELTSILKEQLVVYHTFYQQIPTQALSDEKLKECATRFLEKLRDCFQKGGPFYLPLGYRGDAIRGGHHMPFLMEESGESIRVTSLNQGEGFQNHPLLEYTATAKKCSYRYFSIEIPKRVFFGESGVAAFCLLFKYLSESPPWSARPYEAMDLIQVFLRMGKLIPFSKDADYQKLAVIGQVGPTCSEQGVKLVVRDILYTMGLSQADVERLFLNASLCSLLSAYHVYQAEPSTKVCHLLSHAAKEFGIVAENAVDLCEKERMFCEVLSVTIIKFCRLQSKQRAEVEDDKKEWRLPCATFVFPSLSYIEYGALEEPSLEEETQPLVPRPQFSAKTLSKDLKQWVEIAAQLPPLTARDFVYQCLFTLPIPSATTEDAYGAIPSEEALQIMTLLKSLIAIGVIPTQENTDENFFENFLMLHTVYAIGDRLARLSPKSGLEGFATPFPPLLFSFGSLSNFAIFPLGEESLRSQQIAAYFGAQQGKTIFPFREEIPLETWLHEFMKNPEAPKQEFHHLHFLKQFMKMSQGSVKPVNLFLDMWIQEERLPKEVHLLHYFAFACHVLFSGQGKAKIPEELRFIPTSNARSHVFVEIEAEKGSFTLIPHQQGDFPHHQARCSILAPNDPFVRYFYQASAATTNEVMCATLESFEEIPEPLLRDLLRLFCTPKLRLTSALEWASFHLPHMQNRYVQWGIAQCFFSGDGLQTKLLEESSLIQHARAFFNEGILYYGSSIQDLDTQLFFLRTALFFETHVSQVYGPEVSEKQLGQWIKSLFALTKLNVIPQEKKRALYTLLLFALLREVTPNFSMILPLLFEWPALKEENSLDDWLEEKVIQEYNQKEGEVACYLENGEVRNALCTEIVKGGEKIWEGNYPQFYAKEYSIDFRELSIYRKGELWIPFQNKERVERTYWQIGGKHLAVHPIFFDELELQQSGLSFLASPDFKSYAPCNRSGGLTLFVMNQKSQTPFAKIEYKSGGVVVTRVDSDWNSLPLCLAHPNSVELPFQNKCWPDLLCWVHPKSGVIEELQFFQLGLKFYNKQGELYSSDALFKGYSLDSVQTLTELKDYPGSLLLTHKSGEKKVILRNVELLKIDDDFSKHLFPSTYYLSERRFFTYAYDASKGVLTGDAEANFYLVYLCILEQDYSSALHYLKKQKPHIPKKPILAALQANRDLSPATLALNLHVLIFLFDQVNLLTRSALSQKGEGETCLGKSWAAWATVLYFDYLKCMKEVGSSVPFSLQLSVEQEKRLLKNLEKFEGPPYPTILMRRSLLLSKARSVKATLSKTKIPVFRAFQKLEGITTFEDLKLKQQNAFIYAGEESLDEWTLYPTRVSSTFITDHFLKLYEIARFSPQGWSVPFDFQLLTFINSPLNETSLKLVKVLFIVRYFSAHFADEECGLATEPPKKQIATFNAILDLCEKLMKGQVIRKALESLDYTVDFDFEKEIHISLPPEKPTASQPISLKRRERVALTETIFSLLFEKKALPKKHHQTPPFLDPVLLPEKGTLEGLLYEQLCVGYQELQKQDAARFVLRKESMPHALSLLKEQLGMVSDRIEALRKSINREANRPNWNQPALLSKSEVFTEITTHCLSSCEQMIKLTFENPLVEAVLKGDAELVLKYQPALNEAQACQLMTQVVDYYVFLCQRQRLERGIELLTKMEKTPEDTELEESLLLILDPEAYYDPYLFPDLLIYEVVTATRLRSYQAEKYRAALNDQKKLHSLLYALLAGGGKSSILAILFILRAIREGHFPILITNSALYSVDRDNLIERLLFFGKRPAVFELDISQPMSTETLQNAYQQLSGYCEEKRPLIMVPETYYALYLHYLYEGIVNQDAEKIKWLSLILFEVFEKKGFLLVDESQLNLNPLLKAIFGISKETLPQHEQEIFLEFFQPLEALDRGTTPQELLYTAQKKVAHYMVRCEALKIPDEEYKSFIRYFRNEHEQKPDFLLDMAKNDPKTADLVMISRYFILKLLPDLLIERNRMDHAPSLYPDEEFDVPFDRTRPSYAQYECPYRTLALSTQGTLYRGLTKEQIVKLVELLKLRQNQEKDLIISPSEQTPTDRLWLEWLRETRFRNLTLEQVSTADTRLMDVLYGELKKNRGAIGWYLQEVIYSEVTFSSEQFVCTPSHLLRGFKDPLLYSATPGIQEAYPRVLDDFQQDLPFLAAVVAAFCEERNQGKIYSTQKEPYLFFSELVEANPKIFETVRTLLDPAGYFCDSTNEEVALAGLKIIKEHALPLDGIVYFQDPVGGAVDKQEKILIRLKNRQQVIEVEGSDIKGALGKEGLKWEEIELLVYIDPAHTESSDIAQKEKRDGLFLVEQKLTLSSAVQAAMRMRRFLIDQSIYWVFFQNFEQTIPLGSKGFLDGPALLSWMIGNEGLPLEQKVVATAFQEIDYHVQSLALEEIKENLYDPHQQIQTLLHYAKGFVEQKRKAPFETLDFSTENENTGDVLWAFAKQRLETFGYANRWQEIQDPILSILEETENLIASLPSNYSRTSQHAVRQYAHVRQKTREALLRPKGQTRRPIMVKTRYFSLHSPRFEQEIAASSSHVGTLFQTAHFSKNLRISHQQLATVREADSDLKLSLLKPIEYLLIYKGMAYAVSNEEAAALQCELKEGCPYPAFLITPSGMIVHLGSCDREEAEEVLRSEWLAQVFVDVALLQGEIRHPDLLCARLKKWDDFQEVWKQITEALPYPQRANHIAIKKLTHSV